MEYMSEIRRRWNTWWMTGNVFLSAHGIKLRLSEGSVGRTLVGLEIREKNMASLV